MSFVTVNFKFGSLWNHALKALQHIGSFVDKYPGSVDSQSYMHIVVEKIASMFSPHDEVLPLMLKLEMAVDIGKTGRSYMLKIVGGIEEPIFYNLSEVYVRVKRLSIFMLLLYIGRTFNVFSCCYSLDFQGTSELSFFVVFHGVVPILLYQLRANYCFFFSLIGFWTFYIFRPMAIQNQSRFY